MRGRSREYLFEANGCLTMAKGQLDGALIQLNGGGAGAYRRSCFTAHQTIEMSLKSLIWYHTKSSPRQTHSFRDLISALQDFPQIHLIRDDIIALESLYIGSRYVYRDEHGNLLPDYTKSEAEEAYRVAKEVYKLIRNIVPKSS